MKLLKGIYGDIWWSLSPEWRKHYEEYMMCHMDWNNSVLKKTNKTTKEVAAGKHNFRGRIVRIPGKKGNVSNSWSHRCALWQLLGFGYRKTPDLKTLYKISSKTQLLPLKTSQVPGRQVELSAPIANTKAPKSLCSEWASSVSSNLWQTWGSKGNQPSAPNDDTARNSQPEQIPQALVHLAPHRQDFLAGRRVLYSR